MERVYIGYVQGVHGLRGDLKIKNRFERPEMVFKVGNTIFLNDELHTISACKFYKGFYLVTIDNLKDINLVEKYKGFDVFFNREDMDLKDGYILDDLFGLKIISDNKEYGVVDEILESKNYHILVVSGKKKLMIPLNDVYVESVSLEKGKIYCKDIERLIL